MGQRVQGCSIPILVAGTILIACASQAQAPIDSTPSARSPDSIPSNDSRSSGPKKRIAVIKFDASSAGALGGADLGSGLAAQLTTALINTGQFIVIERSELASVLREQEMSMQKLVASDTAAQAGHLLGAQYLVRASVTQFDQSSGGGGIRIGIGGAAGAGGLGLATNTAIVGIDLRLIDTTTGQVVQSHHAEAKIEDRGISADAGSHGVAFGADTFARTPLGRATQQAVDKAVVFIVEATKPLPWSGRVVDVSGDQVFVNAGANAGIRSGDTLTVSAITRQLTDPASGALLGVIEERLGDIQIVSVQEQYSVARMNAPFQTKRGDLVRAMAH
jgi:curli biogenesis system outer membrane secretion channel CsgG